jgi:hypothetical protein
MEDVEKLKKLLREALPVLLAYQALYEIGQRADELKDLCERIAAELGIKALLPREHR